MDCMMRMKRIRLIDKMKEYPEVTRKLGLKDSSYLTKEQRTFQKGERI